MVHSRLYAHQSCDILKYFLLIDGKCTTETDLAINEPENERQDEP